MFARDDRVLAAVSGGRDSVAMLYCLMILKEVLSIEIAVFHLDHMLRGKESEKDAGFVLQLAKKWKIPYYIITRDVRKFRDTNRLSPEEAAREVRYQCLSEISLKKGYQKIALGHHQNDNAELILMNLIRGSGKSGLSGIPPVRENQYVRPFIRIKKKEIKRFVAKNCLPYVDDSTNQDISFFRNRIRLQILPELKKNYNPKIVESLCRVAELMREEEEWLEELTGSRISELLISKNKNGIILDKDGLSVLPKPFARRIMREGICQIKGHAKGFQKNHIDAICNLIYDKNKGRMETKTLHLPHGISVRTWGGNLEICKTENRENLQKDFVYFIRGPGEILIPEISAKISIVEMDIKDTPELNTLTNSQVLMDRENIEFPLCVRTFQNGDRFHPFGAPGSRKVKRFFTDLKLPLHMRRTVPILTSGNRIIWIAGFRMDESVRIRKKTKKVLYGEITETR